MPKDIAFRHPEIETLDRDAILAIQRRKLEALGARLSASPDWHAHFRQAGLKPADLADPQAFAQAPMLEKADLHARYPYPFLTTPLDNVQRFVATSGTTGLPVLFGFSYRDVALTFREQMARVLTAIGVRPGDKVYQSFGYGLWIGGFALETGSAAVGATVFPLGPGRGELAAQWIRDHGYTVFAGSPLWLRSLIDHARAKGDEPARDWRFHAAMTGGQSFSDGFRRDIESNMPPGFRLHDVYGTTEAGGPIVGIDCPYSHDKNLLHLLNEDSLLTEILDPVTFKPVGAGETGEIVVTTLDKEASPVVRWRTRDLVRIPEHRYDCPCGRKGLPLIGRIIGRSDDMLKVRGVIVFPSQIEDIVAALPGAVPEAWQIYLDKAERSMDALTVAFERRQGFAATADQLRDALTRAFQARLGIHVIVECHEQGALPRYEAKATRVIVRGK
ncbi:MAG: phenylacetate--CoA ligase family protein [Alphaproteobacteria bacterium]